MQTPGGTQNRLNIVFYRREMRIGILQPGYLPWLGFFEQLYKSDVFVLLDDVQYDKHGWRNRNRIKTATGIQWLSIPVNARLSQHQLIYEVRIDSSQNWQRKHLQALRLNYAKAFFFKRYIDFFDEAYHKEWHYLVDVDIFFITSIASFLGIETQKIVRSSALGITGNRNERLVNICRHFNADFFYEGASGRSYINEPLFRDHGIHVEFQDYIHPSYHQIHGPFVPYLSVVDLLFNCGSQSIDIILNRL